MSDIKFEELAEGIRAAQDSRGLLLTTDACLLTAFVSGPAGQSVCELGSGSGIISEMLLLAGKIGSSVCVDVQPEARVLAENNAESCGLSDRMTAVCCDVLDFRPERKFDTVVSNPPYFTAKDGRKNKTEQDKLTRHESTATVRDFAACASRILKDGGNAYFCYTPQRLSELLCALSDAGLEPKTLITVYPTVGHRPSLVLVSAKKGAKKGMVCGRPLIIFKNKPGGEYTEEYLRIEKENRIEF